MESAAGPESPGWHQGGTYLKGRAFHTHYPLSIMDAVLNPADFEGRPFKIKF
jgi:hypothetical protein